MKFIDFITLSTRALSTKTSRTLLTILGMGVGIGAVLFLVSLGYGLQRILVKEITSNKSLLTLDVTPLVDSNFLKLSEEDINKIKNIRGVKDVSPLEELKGKVFFNNLTGDVKLFVVKSSFFDLSGLKEKIIAGNNFSDIEKNKMVIDNSLGEIFGCAEKDCLNKEIIIHLTLKDLKNNEQNIKIKGVISGVLKNQGRNGIFMNLNALSNYQLEGYTLAKIEVTNSNDIKKIRQQLIDAGYSVSTISDTIDQANKIFKAITIILAFFGIIALVVSAIGMFNTMTITLLERTQEIGVMKSIGASNNNITNLFLVESSLMGFLGSICGIFVGLIGEKIFNLGFNILAHALGGENINLFYTPLWFLVFVVLFGTFIGLITGIFPARRAGKLDPLTALRYK